VKMGGAQNKLRTSVATLPLESEILKAVGVRTAICWVVVPCSSVGRYYVSDETASSIFRENDRVRR
jgi:hypothetical protein